MWDSSARLDSEENGTGIDSGFVFGDTYTIELKLNDVTFTAKTGYKIYGYVWADGFDLDPYNFNGTWSNNQQPNKIHVNEISSQSVVGSDGAKYMSTGGNYISLKNSGEFEVSCGLYGFKITSEGIFAKKQNEIWVNIVDKLFK